MYLEILFSNLKQIYMLNSVVDAYLSRLFTNSKHGELMGFLCHLWISLRPPRVTCETTERKRIQSIRCI